jgi:16S rRNA (cytosine1402-N4)-methyltransferase
MERAVGLASFSHRPVMAAQVSAALDLRAGDIFADFTFGRGGHTRDALTQPITKAYGVDRDPQAVAVGKALEIEMQPRFKMLEGAFSSIEMLLAQEGIEKLNAILIDAGVSSPQLDDAARGFSFQKDGPLDMRMAAHGMSAADIVNGWEEEAIADTLFQFGDEKKSRRIARAIVAARKVAPIERTLTLAEIVRKALGFHHGPKDPATRTFQALRIAVNGELDELASALRAAERLLLPEGRLVVIAFHSLEDRIVKEFLRERTGNMPGHSRHLPSVAHHGPLPTFLPCPKPARATDAENIENPRARSAILRSAVRNAAPAWESNT